MTHEHQVKISEETRVNVRLTTAWTMVASMVAGTIWLTMLILRLTFDNQNEHAKLMGGLVELRQQSENWITQVQLEDAISAAEKELNPADYDYIRELKLREAVRRTLRKNYKPL
jgi:hypothetical protein